MKRTLRGTCGIARPDRFKARTGRRTPVAESTFTSSPSSDIIDGPPIPDAGDGLGAAHSVSVFRAGRGGDSDAPRIFNSNQAAGGVKR